LIATPLLVVGSVKVFFRKSLVQQLLMMLLQLAVVLSTLVPSQCTLVGRPLDGSVPGVSLVLATATGEVVREWANAQRDP
jgi:hypothetical protein